MVPGLQIRNIQESDLPDITSIYNQAILAGEQTADLEIIDVKERKAWFAAHDRQLYPVLVALSGTELVGYINLGPYRSGRAALRFTAEVSYYIAQQYQSKGIGSALMQAMLDRCQDLPYKTLIAILIESNAASVALLERFAFQRWGHLPEIAEFDDRIIGQFYYGKRIKI